MKAETPPQFELFCRRLGRRRTDGGAPRGGGVNCSWRSCSSGSNPRAVAEHRFEIIVVRVVQGHVHFTIARQVPNAVAQNKPSMLARKGVNSVSGQGAIPSGRFYFLIRMGSTHPGGDPFSHPAGSSVARRGRVRPSSAAWSRVFTLNWRMDRVGPCPARCALNIPARFSRS